MSSIGHALVLADIGSSLALVLGALGTFIGTLGGVAKFVQWLIKRSDDNKRQTQEEADKAPSVKAERISETIAYYEHEIETLRERAEHAEERADKADKRIDQLRSKVQEGYDVIDDAMGRESKYKIELEELRTKCHRFERESKES